MCCPFTDGKHEKRTGEEDGPLVGNSEHIKGCTGFILVLNHVLNFFMHTYINTHKHLLTINAPVQLNFTDQTDENEIDEEMKILGLDVRLSIGQ